MGDIAQRGNKLTKGVKDLVTGSFKGAKKVAQGARDLITAPSKRIKQFGGGRTRLLEELGRVEAEPSNRNRRAEISRVHGELNKGYKKGGKVKKDKNWIQKAVNPKHKGFCTPMTKKTCTPRRKALARTFKKMARERKSKG